MADSKIMTPHEAEIDKLTQIIALLVAKLGGEVLINRHELEEFFDVPVLSRVISPDYCLLRLSDEDQAVEIEIIDHP
jgi:hypothetical protein